MDDADELGAIRRRRHGAARPGHACSRPCFSRTSSGRPSAPPSWATSAWRSCSSSTTRSFAASSTRFRGEEGDTAGDGFLATFDGPARAIRCAQAIVDGVAALGLEIRAGVHTGECESPRRQVRGNRRVRSARGSRRGGPGEVLVSRRSRISSPGRDSSSTTAGHASSRAFPDQWRLFAVVGCLRRATRRAAT